jgi:hypothetical protein
MIALARRLGYNFKPTPGDWKQVRFEKALVSAVADIPCESWRIAATSGFSANTLSPAL